jgi:hypothetical protein
VCLARALHAQTAASLHDLETAAAAGEVIPPGQLETARQLAGYVARYAQDVTADPVGATERLHAETGAMVEARLRARLAEIEARNGVSDSGEPADAQRQEAGV